MVKIAFFGCGEHAPAYGELISVRGEPVSVRGEPVEPRTTKTQYTDFKEVPFPFDKLVCFALQPGSTMEGCRGEVHLTAICH